MTDAVRRMRAVVLIGAGGPEVMQVREVRRPVAGEGEVLVKVHAFGVNRADILQRRGLYPAPPGAPSDIPGLEFAGEVAGCGDGVVAWEDGAQVMGICGGGGYAEYIAVPAVQLVRVPEGMDMVTAAAIPEAFLTAFDALEQLGVQRGEWVLVHAVGSGVGTAALQLVLARGARCVGTSRSRAKVEGARSLGLEHGVVMGEEDLSEMIRELTGDGVHAVVDLVTGPGLNETLRCMRVGGRLITVGLTGGSRVEVDMGVVLRRRLRITGTVLRSRSAAEKGALTAEFVSRALPGFVRGTLKPVLDRVYPVAEVAAAHARMEVNANFGKVVVSWQG